MTTYHAGDCDVAVIGAGHAGIEAALAAARLGWSPEVTHSEVNRGQSSSFPVEKCQLLFVSVWEHGHIFPSDVSNFQD